MIDRLALQRRGFTLIELMVAVAVVALLTVIAVPAYTSYTLRTNRAVAKAALVSMAAAQETYFVDRKGYSKNPADLNMASDSSQVSYLSRDASTAASSGSNTIYQLTARPLTTNATCPPATGDPTVAGYTLVAVPVGTQTRDTGCATLCLTSSGIRLSSAGTAATCWSR